MPPHSDAHTTQHTHDAVKQARSCSKAVVCMTADLWNSRGKQHRAVMHQSLATNRAMTGRRAPRSASMSQQAAFTTSSCSSLGASSRAAVGSESNACSASPGANIAAWSPFFGFNTNVNTCTAVVALESRACCNKAVSKIGYNCWG